jgi:hypothetical protein
MLIVPALIATVIVATGIALSRVRKLPTLIRATRYRQDWNPVDGRVTLASE